jgi:hypothetical protein
MRRAIAFTLFCTALTLGLAAGRSAYADEAPPPVTSATPAASSTPSSAASPTSSSPSTPSGPSPNVAAVTRRHGVAVLAIDGATDASWRLALRLYRGSLRPAHLDEAHARALAGEQPAPDAPRELVDLYETRAAIHGDDAPSRRLLSSLADSLGVEAIVLVSRDANIGPAVARVYLATSSSFDAARYTEDAGSSDPWQPAALSLERSLRAEPDGQRGGIADRPSFQAPNPPTKMEPQEPQAPRPFYKSGWFWGALGAAVFAGGAVFLATRDDSSSGGPIHVQMKVPR